jgi:hypothetical protein
MKNLRHHAEMFHTRVVYANLSARNHRRADITDHFQ